MPEDTSNQNSAETGVGPRRIGRWIALGVVLALVVSGVGACIRIVAWLGPEQEGVTPVADVASERLLPLGPVVGFASDAESHAWLGLPFARPPVGPLRWRAPLRPEPWAETRDALAPQPACPQVGSRIGGVPAQTASGYAGEEDCLYLNVWAPRVDADGVPSGRERWPVIVWIHGGGNTRGYAAARMFDGALLAGRERVVVVSVAYRLGPLGFFSHPALRAEAADAIEASGNFGLLDQIRALEWVQSQIEEFGGDPANVTIAGESAGALDVYALMLAPRARGLFHRAIAQSGALSSVSREEAESAGTIAPNGAPGSLAAVASLFAEAGVVPDREAALGYAASLASGDLLEFLRGRSAEEILGVYRDPEDEDGLIVPKPIRDGALLPEGDWLARLRAGDFARVPVLAGANRDEWKLYLSQDPAHTHQRLGLFYRIRDPADYERRARLHSDWWMLKGVVEPLEAMRASGHDALFAYRFDWDELAPLLGQDAGELIGAAHGFELPLLFGRFDVGDRLLSRLLYAPPQRASGEALSARMMAYWAAFARTGRPGRGGDPTAAEWPTWRADAGDVETDAATAPPPRWMVLDSEGEGGIRMEVASVTRAALEARIESDPALSREARCALLRELLEDHERLTATALAAASSGRCRLDEAAGGAGGDAG